VSLLRALTGTRLYACIVSCQKQQQYGIHAATSGSGPPIRDNVTGGRAHRRELSLTGTRLYACIVSCQKQQQYGKADQMAQQNRQHEPHMAAALEHLCAAQEELEKAAPNKGGHRELCAGC